LCEAHGYQSVKHNALDVILDHRMTAITGGETGNGQWPSDGKPGILRIQAAFGSRLVGSSMEIQHFAVVGKRLKSVGKAFRDDESFVIGGAEHFGVPAQKGGRIIAQVYGDIKDFAAQATHELDLGMGRALEMHAPHGAANCRQGVVDLSDVPARDKRLKFVSAEESLQIPPAVANGLALQDSQTGKGCIQYVETGAHAWLAAASYA
jgi:hypothetical protein